MSYRYKKLCALLGTMALSITMCMSVTACGNSSEDNTEVTEESNSTAATDMFTDRDREVGYDEESTVAIELKDGASTAQSESVVVEGDVITITEEGSYILSGTLTDGQIIVAAKDAKVQLVLNNVDITCEDSAALYISDADKVFVTSVDGTINSLSTTGEFVAIDDNNIDGAIYSKSDLTLNGGGCLEITCDYGHGIVSKDDLVVTSGEYIVDASSHALSGKDSVRIAGGSFELTAGKDGVHSENEDDEEKGFVYIENGTFTIVSDGDGIDASNYVEIVDGNFDITAGGGYENAEAHTQGSFGGFGGKTGEGKQLNGGEMPNTGEMPEDVEMPEGGEMPKGIEIPEGGQMPEGVEMLEGGQMPEGGQMSEGGEIPDRGQRPNSGDMSKGELADDGTMSGVSDETSEETISTKGIKSDGIMIIHGGEYSINSADDGMHSNSSMEIDGGKIEIASGDDGIHSDEGLVINDGAVNIINSYEGLEGLTITINGGDIDVNASDDGLNAAGGADSSGFGGFGTDSFGASDDIWIEINGGCTYILAGGDGADSNGNLTINGGELYIDGPSDNGNAAIDYGENATAAINGGTVVAVGSSGMLESLDSSSEQGIIMTAVASGISGDEIKLMDSAGNELVSFTAVKAYDSVVISTEKISEGETYTLVTGENEISIVMDELIYDNVSRTGFMR